jgi:tetrahydromethanopterin S-methyltransferase subunit E
VITAIALGLIAVWVLTFPLVLAVAMWDVRTQSRTRTTGDCHYCDGAVLPPQHPDYAHPHGVHP